MRHILTSVVLIVLLFPAHALGEKMDDLVITDGLHYKKFADVPFTGEITGKVQGSFKKGKWDGPWVSYHDNGQLLGRGSYKDGKLDGPYVSYHDNGQIQYKGILKDEVRDGPWVSYNEDGTVYEKYTGTFKDDVKVK